MKTAEPVWIKQISWDIDKKIHGVSDTPTFVDYQLWKLFTGDIADVWYRVEVDKKATHRFRVRGEIEIWNLTSTAITVTHINDEVVVGGAPNSPRVTHPVPIDLSMPNCTGTSTLTVSAELRSSATLDIPASEHAKCRYAKFLGTSKDAFVGP